jgi:peptidyl-prolyl cis-trans isomerase C
LIDDYIREEVAYREGKAIGLDQDDTIIRRRIRQKLDFIAEDLATQSESTEAQLVAFFESRREAYAADARLGFRQIFFDPERHDVGPGPRDLGAGQKAGRRSIKRFAGIG